MCPKVPVNIRLDPGMAEELDAEADSHDRSRSAYIRELLRRRDRILPLDPVADEPESIHARVERLEQAVFEADTDEHAGVTETNTIQHADATGPGTTDHDDAPGWRERLAADLDDLDVPEKHHDRVECLAEYLRENGHLSRKAALENDVVTAWGWDEAKDHLAATSLVERPDQRTWAWAGVESPGP